MEKNDNIDKNGPSDRKDNNEIQNGTFLIDDGSESIKLVFDDDSNYYRITKNVYDSLHEEFDKIAKRLEDGMIGESKIEGQDLIQEKHVHQARKRLFSDNQYQLKSNEAIKKIRDLDSKYEKLILLSQILFTLGILSLGVSLNDFNTGEVSDHHFLTANQIKDMFFLISFFFCLFSAPYHIFLKTTMSDKKKKIILDSINEKPKKKNSASKQREVMEKVNKGIRICKKSTSTDSDFEKAYKYFREGVSHDIARAQYGLGYLYNRGKWVEKDMKKAISFYEKASMQGYAPAEKALRRIKEKHDKEIDPSLKN